MSTDDDAIAEVARAAGARVPFLRPAELATDSAAKLPVIEHLVRHLEAQGQAIARIVDLQPTSPLRDAQDITNALLARPEAALTLSVREAGDNPYFNLVEQGADGWVHLSKGTGNTRRQDAPTVYALNGSTLPFGKTRRCTARSCPSSRSTRRSTVSRGWAWRVAGIAAEASRIMPIRCTRITVPAWSFWFFEMIFEEPCCRQP